MTAEPSPPSQPVPGAVPEARPGGGRGLIVAGIVTAAVGVVVALLSFILLIGGLVGAVGDQFSAPVIDGSGTTTLTLDQGRYKVFQDVNDFVPLGPGQITVAGPDGSSVPVYDVVGHEELARTDGQFVAVAGFDAPRAGVYKVTVSGLAETGGRIVVAHDLVAALAGRGWWGLGIGGGGLLVIVGVVLLAVGLSQRRRASRAAYPAGAYPATYQPQAYQPQAYQPQAYTPQAYAAPAGPPPGWYPDPDPARPGGRRYWDGSAWTGHIA